MPPIPDARTVGEFNTRMLELIPEASRVLDEAIALNNDKKNSNEKGKQALSKSLEELCTELKDASVKLAELSKSAASEGALGRDLLSNVTAKLTQSRKLMGLSASAGLEAFHEDVSHEQMQVFVAAYKADTLEDGVWGGEMEAHLGATHLGFQCNIYVVSGDVVRKQVQIGAGANSQYHLLHQGNHYEVIRDFSHGVMEIPEGRELAWCYVIHTPADGNCLYHSLRTIQQQRHQLPPTVDALRQAVAGQLQDELVEAAVIAILQGGDIGLGSHMGEEWSKMGAKGSKSGADSAKGGSASSDPAQYKDLLKGKTLSGCRTWISMGEMVKKDYLSQISSLEIALGSSQLAAALRTGHGNQVETGGTYFAAWAIRRTDTGSNPKVYTVAAEALGTGEYKSAGMTPNPNQHAEGYWFADVNAAPAPPKGGNKKAPKKGSEPPVVKGSPLEEAAKDKGVVALVCHDSKAPCTDICTARLYVLSHLMGKPILVYGYSDWGHLQASMNKQLQALLDASSDHAFAGQKVASGKLGPVLLFMPKGIFLVGLCDKDDSFLFPGPGSS